MTKEQVIEAAESVLRLAGGKYMSISHTDDGFTAVRIWYYYVVLQSERGSDHWTFKAETTPAGIKAKVQITSKRELHAYGVMPGKAKDNAVEGTAIYDFFWDRMDYLLGKTPEWMSCEIAEEKIEKGIVWGEIKALCGILCLENNMPTGPLLQTTK